MGSGHKYEFVVRPGPEQLERLKALFLERMPGFTTFPSADSDSVYAREERNYKVELVQIFRVESEQFFFAVYEKRRRTSLMGIDQLVPRGFILCDVFLLVRYVMFL